MTWGQVRRGQVRMTCPRRTCPRLRCLAAAVAASTLFAACKSDPLKSYAQAVVNDADRAARVIERFTAGDVRAVAHSATIDADPGAARGMSNDSLSVLTEESIDELSQNTEAFGKTEVSVEVREVHYKLVVALDSGGRSLRRLRGTISDCKWVVGDNSCIYAMRHSLDHVAAATGMYMKYRCALAESLRTRSVQLATFMSPNPKASSCSG